MTKERLGELLVQRDVISAAQLEAALDRQRSCGHRLGAVLLELGFATEEQILSALSLRLGYERIDLDNLARTPGLTTALGLVRQDLAASRCFVPVALSGRTLTVALHDPTDLALVDELSFRTGRRINVVVAGEKEIWRTIARLYCRGGEFDLELAPEPGPDSEGIPLSELIVCSSSRKPPRSVPRDS
jgi:type IV pilus assembly protein PilB